MASKSALVVLGRATKTKSNPCFIFSALAASDILLLILFLTVAFLETFRLTTKPNRLIFRLFFATFKINRLFLKLLPFLKITSKSFFFLILFIFDNIIQLVWLYPFFVSFLSPVCQLLYFAFSKTRGYFFSSSFSAYM